MRGRELPLERLAVRLLFAICGGLALLFAVELAVDLSRSGVTWSDLAVSSRAGQGLASTVSRAFNNLTAMVLTFIALAVPITANMYTPKLVEIFVRDRVNLAAMLYFAGFGAHAVYAQAVMFENASWRPDLHYAVLVTSGVVGFAVLVPYYFYVLNFLDPATIIRRVRDLTYREIERAAAGVHDVADARRRLDQEILNLGNVILRAVDRADRDVSIDAVSALRQVVTRYAEVKPGLPAAWFAVDRKRFAGYTPAAVDFMERDRVWVEQRCLHQLFLAYCAALARMPDAVSAICDVNRQLARHARETRDERLLALCVRFFNTFLREAVKKKDVHAIYDVSSQYAALACDLAADHPALALEIARHFRYYADFARAQGLDFVYELAAYDLGAVVEAAHAAGSPTRDAVLGVFLAFDGERQSERLTKAQAILGAQLAAAGHAAAADRVRAALVKAPPARIAAAREQIVGTEDPLFWEVTDRQKNLDWVDPARRAAVAAFLDECEAAARADADRRA